MSNVRRRFRHVATTAEWKHITEQKLGACRGCGAEPESRHHLVPRSLGGDDVADNIIFLCGDGTRGCHGVLENRTKGWDRIARNVRESLTSDELGYITRMKGDYFLGRYYPAAVAA